MTEAVTTALAGSAPVPAPKVTLPRELFRVLRVWPDWLFGMFASMGLGLATGAFLYWDPFSGRVRDPLTLIVTIVLTAAADASLTNQLAAEPEWAIRVLTGGGDPARMLRVRNQVLYIFEAGFAFGVAALVIVLTKDHHWVKHNWPIIAELPLAPIAAGNLASVLFPCPFMRLRHRLQATTTWPRWGAYIGIPFALTSLGTATVMGFPAWMEQQVKHSAAKMHHRPSWLTADNIHYATWLIAVPVLNLLIWAIALKAADSLAHLRRHQLVTLMRKHTELAQDMDDISLWEAVRALPANLKQIPSEVRDIATVEIEEVRQVGGHLDRGLEHALARQAAKIRARRAAEQSSGVA
ncbi:hypothetical protein [Catenulispora pinisilvae]|uniref:hypothetical protein n=1 Tax=Catenulispora pinisilvae TaxID=2705253 RepID=UPI001890D904|nr:hypothetical protein [Catenulispora pinisilvae]